MPALVATAVWTISSALIVALDERLGEPIDAYVNGSQVWLRPDGPDGITLEYRLHPVGGYAKPKGMPTDQVFSRIALMLGADGDTGGVREEVEFASLWEGLEVFCAFDDETPLEPATLAAIGESILEIPAMIYGLVDHEGIAQRWQSSERKTSIVQELLTQLGISR